MLRLITMILPIICIADIVRLDFKGVSGHYDQLVGQAYAEKALYEIYDYEIEHNKVNVSFKKENEAIKLTGPFTKVHFKMDFSFLSFFNTVIFEKVDFDLTKDGFSLQTPKLKAKIGEQDLNIDDVVISTKQMNPAADDLIKEFAKVFTQGAQLDIKRVFYNKVTLEEFKKTLGYDNIKLSQITFNPKNKLPRLSGFRLVTNEGSFTLSTFVDSWINGWFKIYGRTSFDEENYSLILDIQKAKYGILNIKKFVLKSLKKLENENIRLEGQKLIVRLKD